MIGGTLTVENKLVGKRVAELRKKRGLSQTSFAEKIHMSPSTVAMWEVGEREIKSSTLHQLADFFGVSTDYLLGRTDDAIDPMDQFHTIAAHRSDDPASELPEEAKQSLEDFKKYLLKKHGLIKDEE